MRWGTTVTNITRVPYSKGEGTTLNYSTRVHYSTEDKSLKQLVVIKYTRV